MKMMFGLSADIAAGVETVISTISSAITVVRIRLHIFAFSGIEGFEGFKGVEFRDRLYSDSLKGNDISVFYAVIERHMNGF